MKNRIGIISRALLALCGLALVAVLFVPLWRIDLVAPQYPEGLYLLIHSNKLSGNVDIINGLNHYIGMKTLHAADFVEFRVLPFIIVFFAVLFFIVAFTAKRKHVYILFALFILFGAVALADFWKWEYNYGHRLDPDAAIKVPGMSYQPPLIGYKQLLNFSAYSFPSTGAWIFVGCGLSLLFITILEWLKVRHLKRKIISTVVLVLSLTLLSSCSRGPQKIKLGVDVCSFCKMTISDPKYGAELVTKKGKIFKFDDSHCLLSYLKNSIEAKEISGLYFTNFSGDHQLLPEEKVFLLKSDSLRTPMGGQVAAFSNWEEANKMSHQLSGGVLTWAELKRQ